MGSVVLSRMQSLSVAQLVAPHDETLTRVPASCDAVQVGSIFAEPVVDFRRQKALKLKYVLPLYLPLYLQCPGLQLQILQQPDRVPRSQRRGSIGESPVEHCEHGCVPR
jgi:hypothetical protein